MRIADFLFALSLVSASVLVLPQGSPVRPNPRPATRPRSPMKVEVLRKRRAMAFGCCDVRTSSCCRLSWLWLTGQNWPISATASRRPRWICAGLIFRTRPFVSNSLGNSSLCERCLIMQNGGRPTKAGSRSASGPTALEQNRGPSDVRGLPQPPSPNEHHGRIGAARRPRSR
jgi:hypothetical protein